MIEDITDEYDRLKHQQQSNMTYAAEYLKFVFKDSIIGGLIKPYIVGWIQGIYAGTNQTFKLSDQAFKDCLLCEANLQFNKALYNWSIYKR
jgi:hypothetical protein